MEATEQLGWNLTSWYKNGLVSGFLNFKSEDFFESKMKAKHAMVVKSHKMVWNYLKGSLWAKDFEFLRIWVSWPFSWYQSGSGHDSGEKEDSSS